MLHVHPHRPARAGDFVVVQLANGGDDTHGVVKRFVSRSDNALVVEQMNPSKKISYPADDVRAVHLIVGSTS
jgi:phage repressor protein C with HTH and peptisase S24 domain